MLTLKAGSKLYATNGKNADGSNKFDEVVVQQDTKINTSGVSGKFLDCYRIHDKKAWGNNLVTNCGSGTDATGVTGFYYRTDTNKLDFYNKGTAEGSTWSLPICILDSANGTVNAIDQVFNGFGYIGSTVFALPGVKGLIPNGRNEDGSLKNIEFTVGKVLTQTLTATFSNGILCVNSGSVNVFGFIDSKPIFEWATYQKDENQNYLSLVKTDYSFQGKVTTSSGTITSFTPKTAFHAVDYSDYAREIDRCAKLDKDNTFKGANTFTENVDIVKVYPCSVTRNSAMTRGTYNSSQGENKFINQDKNGKFLSEMRTYVESSDSATSLCLGAITEDTSGNQVYKTVFRGTAHKDGTSEVSLTGVNAVYAQHPPASDNSNKLATTNWVTDPTKSTNVVHKTGNETINNTKTFTANPYVSTNTESRYQCKTLTYAQGTAPANNVFGGYSFKDKNGVEMATCYGVINTSNTSGCYLWVRSPVAGSTSVAQMGIQCDTNGNFSTQAPTPATSSNSNNIATTAWCRTAGNGLVHTSGDETISGHKTLAPFYVSKENSDKEGGQIYFNSADKEVNAGKPMYIERCNGRFKFGGNDSSNNVRVPLQIDIQNNTCYGITPPTNDNSKKIATIEWVNTKLNNSSVSSIISSIYPVGSIYIGVQSTCPIAALISGSKWTLIAQDRVLQGAGTRGAVGTTINESLPNITGSFYALDQVNAYTGAFSRGATRSGGYGGGGAYDYRQQVMDASKVSSTYQNNAPVQQNAYLVNIWQRTS